MNSSASPLRSWLRAPGRLKPCVWRLIPPKRRELGDLYMQSDRHALRAVKVQAKGSPFLSTEPASPPPALRSSSSPGVAPTGLRPRARRPVASPRTAPSAGGGAGLRGFVMQLNCFGESQPLELVGREALSTLPWACFIPLCTSIFPKLKFNLSLVRSAGCARSSSSSSSSSNMNRQQ